MGHWNATFERVAYLPHTWATVVVKQLGRLILASKVGTLLLTRTLLHLVRIIRLLPGREARVRRTLVSLISPTQSVRVKRPLRQDYPVLALCCTSCEALAFGITCPSVHIGRDSSRLNWSPILLHLPCIGIFSTSPLVASSRTHQTFWASVVSSLQHTSEVALEPRLRNPELCLWVAQTVSSRLVNPAYEVRSDRRDALHRFYGPVGMTHRRSTHVCKSSANATDRTPWSCTWALGPGD